MTIFAELLKSSLRKHCPNVMCSSISQHVDDFDVILKRDQSPEYWLLCAVDIIDHQVRIGTEYKGRIHPLWDTILDMRDPEFFDKFIRTFDRIYAKYGPQDDDQQNAATTG